MANNKKIRTDNISLLDNLVYYLKRLATECVIKNDYVADMNETLKSRQAYDRYKLCITGNAKYEMFDYSFDELRQTSAKTEDMYGILKDKSTASDKVKQELLEIKVKKIINSYAELNNYYRMLNGLPDIEDTSDIYVETQDLIEDEDRIVPLDVPIHDMTVEQQEYLNASGIIDNYIDKYPTKKYLKYIGYKKIEYHYARSTPPFGLLYMPKDGIPAEVYSRWKDKYNINRVYVMKTIYDHEAFIDENKHYDDFISMFIVLETMIDILAELPDFIIKRDIFDLGMVRLILKSYDVDYFPDIPLSYQQAIVRNINKLIEFKATGRGIVNICSIFGCDNIEVFKYYLFKTRKIDENGNYTFHEKESDNYNLKFIKAPLMENIDDYIYDESKHLLYDDVTYGDDLWDGGLDHEYLKDLIKSYNFNYLQSKYYSIDCVFSMTEILFELVYFYNMIFDDVFSEDLLKVNLHNIDTRHMFRLVDVFCFLFALGYTYYGLEDQIIFDPENILYIKGFDFNTNMSELAEYIYEKTQGFTNLTELGVDSFITFENDEKVLSYSQLSDMFMNNKKIYNHVIHQLTHANNKRMYDIYKDIYDALMIEELTTDFFQDPEGNVYYSFTEYLKDKDTILYQTLIDIKNMSEDERLQAASTMIDDVIYILDHKYLTDAAYEKIYRCFPTSDANSIIFYIKELIDFFKSYKMQLDELNIVYLLDDKYENWVGAIDDVIQKITVMPSDCGDGEDKDKLMQHFKKVISDIKDDLTQEQLYMVIEYWEGKGIFDEAFPIEELLNCVTLTQIEGHIIWEDLKINKTYK